MNAGDTFLFPGADDHLWMIISDPSCDAGKVVIVCILSWQIHYDQACVLEAGDHPFVKHATCVNYPGARVVADGKLEELKSQEKLKLRAPLSPQILERIRTHAADGQTPTKVCEVLREQGFMD